MQKIGEIKCEIQAAEPGEYATLFEKYKEDTRSGVRKLLEQLHKKEEAYQKELLSKNEMRSKIPVTPTIRSKHKRRSNAF